LQLSGYTRLLLDDEVEANPDGTIAASDIDNSASLGFAKVDSSKKLTFQAFLNNIQSLLTGKIAAQGSVTKTTQMDGVDSGGAILKISPDKISEGTKLQAKYKSVASQGSQLYIVKAIYTTKALKIQTSTNIQGSGSFTEGNGNGSSNPAPTCDSSQPIPAGNGAGAALCIVNSNTLQITTQNDHVFAISLVKVSGTGTTIAAPVPKGTLAVITQRKHKSL
jgi:hypothetical protein